MPPDGRSLPVHPTVSVVVPTRNRAGGLLDALGPLLADPATHELVVVDDGSSDATPEVLAGLGEREPRLRQVRREGVGAAAARQVGVEVATGDLLLFVDDDVIACSGLVSGHRHRHSTSGVELVVVGYMPVRRPERRGPGDAATLIYATEYENCCEAWRRDPADILLRFWAGNVSIARRRCLAVPLPSPHAAIAYHEDEDFGLRLREAGVRAVFDPSLLAEHRYRRPLPAFLLDAYRQGSDRWHLRAAYPQLEADLGWSLVPKAVPLTERPLGHRLSLLLAVTAARWAGHLHLWAVETDALRLARRLERRRGYTDAARGVEPVAAR